MALDDTQASPTADEAAQPTDLRLPWTRASEGTLEKKKELCLITHTRAHKRTTIVLWVCEHADKNVSGSDWLQMSRSGWCSGDVKFCAKTKSH